MNGELSMFTGKCHAKTEIGPGSTEIRLCRAERRTTDLRTHFVLKYHRYHGLLESLLDDLNFFLDI